MKDKSLIENMHEFSDVIKAYIEARIDLLKLGIVEKIARIGTYFVSTIFIAITILVALVFLTQAFVGWYDEAYGSSSVALLISAGFYILLAIVIFLFRKQLLTNRIVKNMAEILFDEDEND
ncbi:MAG: phage holin family protein [Bacteroidales bacterium]